MERTHTGREATRRGDTHLSSGMPRSFWIFFTMASVFSTASCVCSVRAGSMADTAAWEGEGQGGGEASHQRAAAAGLEGGGVLAA